MTCVNQETGVVGDISCKGFLHSDVIDDELLNI